MSNLQTPKHGQLSITKILFPLQDLVLIAWSISESAAEPSPGCALSSVIPPMPELTSTDTSLYFTPYCTSMPSYQVSLL